VSFLDRILDGMNSLFYSKKKSISLSSRTLAVAVVMMTVTTVIPTLAEDLLPPTEVAESSTSPAEPTSDSSPEPVADQPEPETTPVASEAPAALSEEEKAKAEEERKAEEDAKAEEERKEEERKAEEAKVKVAPVQPQINFRFPNSVALDPRAAVANLPQVAITGGSMGLLCLSANGIIDINSKGLSNNVAVTPPVVAPVTKSGDKDADAAAATAAAATAAAIAKANKTALQVAGDLSPFVRVSGPLYQINALINGSDGIRVTSWQGRLAGSNLNARYVELTGSDLSPEFCSKATFQRSITFRALGLQMETVKTRVEFNKPSGK
jgi:outer membrane biosynthesis protein TonB